MADREAARFAEHHVALTTVALPPASACRRSDDQIVEAVPIHVTRAAYGKTRLNSPAHQIRIEAEARCCRPDWPGSVSPDTATFSVAAPCVPNTANVAFTAEQLVTLLSPCRAPMITIVVQPSPFTITVLLWLAE